jgi:hypothetical protein
VNAVVRVTGTTDPADIAAVVAALAGRGSEAPVDAYEQWRRRRTAALRASRGR